MNEIQLPSKPGRLGPDEEQILRALRVPPPEAGGVRGAAFKIEVHWGKSRTVQGPNTGAILIWESGKRFHGGGDERMYWCGYKDCGLPIRSEFFSQFHVACPHCRRECFLDPATKDQFLSAKGLSSGRKAGLLAMPICVGEKLFRSKTRDVAVMLAKLFRDLGSNADVYMKYHPTDIRCRNIEKDGKKVAQYHKARDARNRGLLIYPMNRIIRDVAVGATLESRMLAVCTA